MRRAGLRRRGLLDLEHLQHRIERVAQMLGAGLAAAQPRGGDELDLDRAVGERVQRARRELDLDAVGLVYTNLAPNNRSNNERYRPVHKKTRKLKKGRPRY